MDDKFNFSTPLSSMRFQSQLGKEAKRMYKEGNNIVRLSLARVTKVNYKYNTVDLMTTLHKNTSSKNPSDNGKFSARLPVAFGGKTPDGKAYGTNTLVTIGSLVLVGFLEGNKDHPIVLNIYSDSDNQSQLTRTTMTSADESDESIQQELWQLFTLYPSMTYRNIDGRGNQEVTFSGKSFMYITDSDPENDYVNDAEFDYDLLPSSRYANGELIEPASPNSPTVLYVHQGIYDDHRVTFFIKSDGTVRLGSRHIEGEGITFQELRTDGSYVIMQQKDTNNPEEESEVFSKLELTAAGNFILQTPDHTFEIMEDGLLLDGKPIAAGIGGLPELDELQDTITNITTSIEIMNGKIESKISREEYDIDLGAVREYAAGLTAGVQKEVTDLTKSLTDLDTYVDGAFLDGVVAEAERAAITTHLNELAKEKQDLDAKFTEISMNTYLPANQKTALTNTKNSYNTRHEELILAINLAIADGKVLSEEKTSVDTAFANYSSAITGLTIGFEMAIDAIASAKAKEAFDNSTGYVDGEITKVNSTITQLAESITSKVESETFTNAISNLESTKASVETTNAISGRIDGIDTTIDDVVSNIPYRAEITSTQGSVFKNGIVNTTLFCRVYRGAAEVTDTIPVSRFRWTRVSDDTAGDTAWNSKYAAGAKSVAITPEDVKVRATFNCEVLDENNQ